MTTPAAARLYEAQHLASVDGRGWAVHNPHDKPIAELPAIYAWNNGGEPGWYSGVLLAEDGSGLGGHICSSEAYMLSDLGVLEGSRPDRHETFREHYPDGYRMEWVPSSTVMSHTGIEDAVKLNREQAASAKTGGAGD